MRFLSLALLLFGLSICLPSQAQPLTNFNLTLLLEAQGEHSLGLHSVWLEDPSQELSPQQALENPHWQESTTEHLNFGFSSSAFWLATKLRTSQTQQWALWNKYALIDLTEVWTCPLPIKGIEKDRKSTLNSSHVRISYAVFCL